MNDPLYFVVTLGKKERAIKAYLYLALRSFPKGIHIFCCLISYPFEFNNTRYIFPIEALCTSLSLGEHTYLNAS